MIKENKANTSILIVYSGGETRRAIVNDDIEKQISKGHYLQIKTVHPSKAEILEVSCFNYPQLKPAKPNVIFGVLANGEIFVEVGGEQFTPDDAFYKMSTLQASCLAHKVRDLRDENMNLRTEVKELTKKIGGYLSYSNRISNLVNEFDNEGER